MKVAHRGREIVLPDFLIVGAMRSGTTSLYNYLREHPAIFMPALKEPQFFSYFGQPVSPHPPRIRRDPWNLEDYLKLFEDAPAGRIIGEASTTYIYMYERAIPAIEAVYGERAQDVRMIGILRNPIDRAWSLYALKKQGGDWPEDFLTIARRFEEEGNRYQYYNFLASGSYSAQVEAFRRRFPHTKFFLFEELKRDPERVVRTCLQFIGVEDLSAPTRTETVYNYSGVPRNRIVAPIHRFLFGRSRLKEALKVFLPEELRMEAKRRLGNNISKKIPMPSAAREYLHQRYAKDIERLAELFSNDCQKEIIRSWLGSKEPV